MARARSKSGTSGTGGARASGRPLSPRAGLVLLGLFLLLGLVVVGLNALRSAPTAQPDITTTTPATASVPARQPTAGSRATAATAPTTGARGGSSVSVAPPSQTPGRDAALRTKALFVLSVVDATGQAPDGYVGGRQFMNDGRGGTTALPARDSAGRRIVYHEYDVNPKVSGVDRGPQRLVVGDDGSAWTTADHYVTWKRVR